MARIIAIDFGLKRMGIAVTDPMQIIASGLTTVRAHEIYQFLAEYFSREEVECIVIGKPLQMNNQESEVFKPLKQFVTSLKRKFPAMRIEMMDERFTSMIAAKAMYEGGMKKSERQKKENLDKVSAAVILQSFLEQEANKTDKI